MSGTDLAGRTFLVTGANSGLGRATVEALAERGGAVVLASRSEERTRPVLEAIRQRYPAADARFLRGGRRRTSARCVGPRRRSSRPASGSTSW